MSGATGGDEAVRTIRLRQIVAIVVSVDSPAGRVASLLDDLTAHLPPPGSPKDCPLCSAQPWPCARFAGTAQEVISTGVRLADFVPLDLHPYLWPTGQS